MSFDFDTVIPRRGTDCVKWDHYGPDAIPMWVADMDFKAAPAILEALQRRLDHGIFGYPQLSDRYFGAITRWFARRHAWYFTKEDIIPTTGVIAAYSACIKAMTVPGDKVIIQTPVYNCFFPAVRNNRCVESRNELVYRDGRYSIDFEDLERRAADPAAKVLLLCNPHNPVGRVWTREELQRIGDICLKHHVFVVSDEIHCELTYPGHHYTPFGSIGEAYVRNSATCCSPTKAFNIAGIQIANIVAADPQARDVERLRGGDAGHAVLPAGLGHRGEGHVIPARIGQVAVDLVGHHDHVMLRAQLAHPRQLLPAPQLSHGVVGVAQQQQRGLRIRQPRLQIVKVQPVCPVLVAQRTLQGPPPVVDDGIEEDVGDRRHHHHVLVRRCQLAHDAGDGGHHPGAERQPLRLHLKAVAALPPADNSLLPFLRHDGIAEHAVLRPLQYGLADLRRGLKVHVRHPHRQLVRRDVPLQGSRPPTLHHRIKIVHIHALLFPVTCSPSKP